MQQLIPLFLGSWINTQEPTGISDNSFDHCTGLKYLYVFQIGLFHIW